MTESVLNPISISQYKRVLTSSNNNGYGGANVFRNLTTTIGSGHHGTSVLNRIIMSLQSGLDSEVSWALSYMTQVSCTEPLSIELEVLPYLGTELIKYFVKPFQLIIENKAKDVTHKQLALSLDSLLTLRNLAQDLGNQQWLSQVKTLKKSIVEVLKFFIHWFYQPYKRDFCMVQFDNLFREGFAYLIDLLEPLSCYYIDNSKTDPLFAQLLLTATLTNDKFLLVNILNCLSHLLIIKDGFNSSPEENKTEYNETEDSTPKDIKVLNNVIDTIQESHLQKFVELLLVNDDELTTAVFGFLKQYLLSEAPHPQYSNSIKKSQQARLRKLLQLSSTKSNFSILAKQLPLILLSSLPLSDPNNISKMPPTFLSKRSQYISVPNTVPTLPADLFNVIVRLPEPLRATTWLRCCYEPIYDFNVKTIDPNVIPGEVTQISLWKAYEKQFEDVWQDKEKVNPEWLPLLPALEFIRNVNAAFPNSEVMQITVDSPGQPPKKKFIIKGIQPRQFAVGIDDGNYEAFRHFSDSTTQQGLESGESLPVGHVDMQKFNINLNKVNDSLAANGTQVTENDVSPLNQSAFDLLDLMITNVLETEDNVEDLEAIFKLHNSHWLPELIYANPCLVDIGLVKGSWFRYLL
ncbi:Chromatin structure-remodeling complex protein rsc9 [Scheffersomyces spartinae]|uniref:Chromatin structure-remodeling complex protein rsc9 n=1 Tax=Scheffersomyces spartinae TaxID=45513 RepID=A0A9P7VDW7_9ASCO|nr:Chromatin structure-remodeling complex protein rsc9 [Scheffersomyces spartinae]KAG7196176.1 Chromatin structure-remodeling complex protein rsc9 [Scheffersomyces spartinae]